MGAVNPELISYIETKIFPEYGKNDAGHSLRHINYVIRRSLNFAEQFSGINTDIVYAVAAFHDIAHHIDKKNHEKLSAEIFYKDEKMKAFFSDAQRNIIKEAIEDHRASLDGEPRSDYGKIISSADRSTDAEEFLRRTHAYTLKYFPGISEEEIIERGYSHTLEKYGSKGYAKHYVKDEEYENFRKYINSILKDKETFSEKYKEINTEKTDV